MRGERIVVGLSGGVDSAVAALLLARAGALLHCVFLRLWGDAGGRSSCCSAEALARARRVARVLDAPFEVLDVQAAFRAEVVEPWVRASVAGETPNPCLACNQRVKLAALLQRAHELGASSCATGHYARSARDDGGRPVLLRARDAAKDQSYALARLTDEQLAQLHLPLGERTKAEVRALAQEAALPTWQTRESMDLCFAPGGAAAFLERVAPDALVPGSIVDRDGDAAGASHRGLARYTVGQRRGLPLSGTGTARYVLDRDVRANVLVVGETHRLQTSTCRLRDVALRGGRGGGTYRLSAQVRAHAHAREATVTVRGGSAELRFATPERAVTPGQAAVLYEGDVCVGVGTIERAVEERAAARAPVDGLRTAA